MENMQKQSLQAAMLKDIHNQRLGSLSSSSAASEKSKSHSDLSSIELGKFFKPFDQLNESCLKLWPKNWFGEHPSGIII